MAGNPSRRRRLWNAIAVALIVLVVWGGTASVWWLSRYTLAVKRLTRGVGDTVFLTAKGEEWFRLDEQRRDVPLPEIAADLQQAVIAIEDRRFYYHPGVDPVGIGRALARNVDAGGRVEGGSTLTQQLARILFLSNVRTYGRKIKEAAIALMLELQLSKPQILELYLNRVYLSAGVYGVEAMSQHLFRKPAKSLTLAESALIAGLLRAPSALSPWSNYDGALERGRLVLAEMRRQGRISAETEAAARRVRPAIQPYRQTRQVAAGWAKDYLRQQFRDEFGGDHPPDWTVRTSFDRSLQDAAERAVKAGLQRLGSPGLEAALVAIDPATGNVLAMVGGADYARSTFNRATRARRQPGSAFKPFVYAAALSQGYSPVTVLSDLGGVDAPDSPEWLPVDTRHADASSLTLRAALVESSNVAAVDLQRRVGSRAVLRVARDAGLRGLPDVPSLALGSGLVTPLTLTAAYTMFPAGGEMVRPRALVAVFDASGAQVLDRQVNRVRILSPDVAFQMVSMLRDVVDRGTGRPVRNLGVRGAFAGKTGTTDDYHDGWFVGFSPSLVAGVWVGFDRPTTIGRDAYAARTALPIWADFIKRADAAASRGEFAVPGSLRAEELCSVSYLQPLNECPVYTEYFKEGDNVPSQRCPVHRGTLRQRALRTVQGWFRSLGGKIGGVFGR
jgi:penicillin-binding protein 1A